VARTKASLSSGARLADYLSTSLLARVYPTPLVVELLESHGCSSQRERSFPAPVVVYYCMALNLYPEAAYEDVFGAVAQGLAWRQGNSAPVTIKKSSINVARSRLSWPLFKDLQQRACVPLAHAKTSPQAKTQGQVSILLV